MAPTAQPNLLDVDWSQIPAPPDDGAGRHLEGMIVPDVALAATDGTQVSLAKIPGRVVVFAYPRTGVPGKVSLVEVAQRAGVSTATAGRVLGGYGYSSDEIRDRPGFFGLAGLHRCR